MNVSEKLSHKQEIISTSRATKRTSDDLCQELYEAYSEDSKWQRYGVQLHLDLDVVHESLFNQIDRLKIKLLCRCIYKMIMRGEDFRMVFASLRRVFQGYEARRDFYQLLIDPYLMLDHAMKVSRSGNADANFLNS